MMNGRSLHWVFKVADRTLTAQFYREVLGMKVLRHEEFTQGCEAACNGPYDNRWSKTMVGYGPEDNHFVVELTYNYNVHGYKLGNDFRGITINSKESIERAKSAGWKIERETAQECVVLAPGGFPFTLINKSQPSSSDPVVKVQLASSDLKRTISYWRDLLGLTLFESDSERAVFGFDEKQAKLEFVQINDPIDHGEAYGRIAFSVPYDNLSGIESKVKDAGHTILTPKITLDTPGKASVTVVILADPDGYEICFVDDENFRKLSAVDPEGDSLLSRYIKKDVERLAKQ